MANFNFYTAIPASIYMALRQSIKIRELKRLFKYWIFWCTTLEKYLPKV